MCIMWYVSTLRSHFILLPGIETWWSCSGLMEFCHSPSAIGCFPVQWKFKHRCRDPRLNRWNRLNFCHIYLCILEVSCVVCHCLRCNASASWFAFLSNCLSKFGQVNPKEIHFLVFKGPICLQSRCLRHAQLAGSGEFWLQHHLLHSPHHSETVAMFLNSGPLPQVVNTLKRALIICISIQAGSCWFVVEGQRKWRHVYISGVGLVQTKIRYVVKLEPCSLWGLRQSGQFADAVGLISQLLVASNLPQPSAVLLWCCHRVSQCLTGRHISICFQSIYPGHPNHSRPVFA